MEIINLTATEMLSLPRFKQFQVDWNDAVLKANCRKGDTNDHGGG